MLAWLLARSATLSASSVMPIRRTRHGYGGGFDGVPRTVRQNNSMFLYRVGFGVGVLSRKARLMSFRREERSNGISKGSGATSSDLRNVVLAQCSVDSVIEEGHWRPAIAAEKNRADLKKAPAALR